MYRWSALLCVCIGADPDDWHSPAAIADTLSAIFRWSVDPGSGIKLASSQSIRILLDLQQKTWPSQMFHCRTTSDVDRNPHEVEILAYVAFRSERRDSFRFVLGICALFPWDTATCFLTATKTKYKLQLTKSPCISREKSASNWLAAAWRYG